MILKRWWERRITRSDWRHLSILVAQHASEFSAGTGAHTANLKLWEKIQPRCRWPKTS